jgi:sugar phosphate isomerase/epimerase
MRFGISTHLFHGERLTRGHFARIAARGFSLVELFATATHLDYRSAGAVADVRGWLDDLRLSAWSLHAPIVDSFVGGTWGRGYSLAATNAARRQEALDETLAALEAARLLGCSTMVVHRGVPGPAGRPDDNDAGALQRSLPLLVEASRAAGVRLALEVLPAPLASPEALGAWFTADHGLAETGVCLDFGHAHLIGDAAEAVEALSGHVITTHVHDNTGRSDDHLLPFAGTIDWDATMIALSKVGYAGPLMFELPDHGDAERTLDEAVGARRRLQAILSDLADLARGFETVE